jgi:hypothetical protein
MISACGAVSKLFYLSVNLYGHLICHAGRRKMKQGQKHPP